MRIADKDIRSAIRFRHKRFAADATQANTATNLVLASHHRKRCPDIVGWYNG